MTLRVKGVAFTGQWSLLTFQPNSWGSSGEDNEMCVYLVNLHFGVFFLKASSIVHSWLKPWGLKIWSSIGWAGLVCVGLIKPSHLISFNFGQKENCL